MTSEPIDLADDDWAAVRALIATGLYASPAEVISAGLRLVEDRAADEMEKVRQLRAAIQTGADDIEAGRYVVLRGATETRAYIARLGETAEARMRSRS